MSAIRVSVTAEDIAAGAQPSPGEAHNRFWATPIEEALARLTGENVDVDGGDGTGCIATIGQGTWTLVVDLPPEVNRFLDARWNGELDGEPFTFEIELDDWIVALIARAAASEHSEAVVDPACGAIARRNSVDGQLYPCGFPRSDDVHGSAEACSELKGQPCDRPDEHHDFLEEVPA